MSSQTRTSLGFLFMGVLGVLIGAVVITLLAPKFWPTQQASLSYNAASAEPLAPIGTDNLEQRIIKVVKQSEPSVVLIKTTVHGVQQIYNPFQNDPFFRQFFGDQGPQSQSFTVQASGSGFVIKREGDTAYVATNAHVVYHADKVQVLLSTGRQVDAEVVGSDDDADLAILKIHGSNLPSALPLGNSSALQQGQFVLAIGEPESFQNSVSLGIVSAIHRSGIDAGGGAGFPTFHYSDMIQITTPINPGNSGGPLITTGGQVVGINAVVAEEAQAIGFSIPINAAAPVLAEIENDRTRHSRAAPVHRHSDARTQYADRKLSRLQWRRRASSSRTSSRRARPTKPDCKLATSFWSSITKRSRAWTKYATPLPR